MKLSVIIVSYNVKYYLEQCLHSVFAARQQGIALEAFVVDNNSPDGSAHYLRRQFPKASYPYLHIISNAENVGFGRANNQALRMAKGEYVLFLNPDTLLTEHTLKECLDYADAHAGLGGLGTMMMHDNGLFAYESRRGMPTPWVSFCKMTGLNALFPYSRRFGRYYMRYLDKESPARIEIISGAFLLVRKAVLDNIGGFDEDFFMYGEDIDLSYRILNAGYENHYVPSPIIHYKGESTKKNTFRYVHVFYNAMLIFFKKHYHSYWLGLSIPIKLAILFSALLALLKLQLRLLRRFLLPARRKKPQERMLYVGRHGERFLQLAEEWGIRAEVLEGSEPDGAEPQLPPCKDYDRVVFDAADFSYAYMLSAIRRSTHRCYLGVYHSDKELLITGAKIFVPQSVEL